jgi:ATP-dependent DNA helicase RecG
VRDVTVCGTLLSVDAIVTSRRALRIVHALLGDSTGTLALKWFNQSYLGPAGAGQMLMQRSGQIGGLLSVGVLENPQFEIVAPGDAGSLHTGRLTPIYHETRGLNSRALRVLVDHVLATAAGIDEECLPEEVRTRHRLLPRPDAIRSAHFPPSEADLAQYNAGASPAHRRLVFEELFLLEIGLAMRRRRRSGNGTVWCSGATLRGSRRCGRPRRFSPPGPNDASSARCWRTWRPRGR